MFTRTSRYYGLPLGEIADIDGEPTIKFVRRRFIPIDVGGQVMARHTVAAGDRLDNVTARYLGDPELFWQVCDANFVMVPADATAETGRVLRILLPQGR